MVVGDRELKRFREWLLEEMLVVPGTADLYVRDVRIAFSHGSPITFLKDGNGLAPKTLQHYLAALRAWANYQEDGDLIRKLGKRMSRALPQPTVRTPKFPLSDEVWAAFRDELVKAKTYLSPPMWAVIEFMARRGARVSDVLRLDRRTAREALREPAFYLSTKKNKRLRVRTERVRECLETFVAQGGWERVEDLVSPDSDPEQRRKTAAVSVWRAVKRVAESAGLKDVHPHKLRRTVAARFLDRAGGDMNRLMDYFNWSSFEVARGYVAQRDQGRMDEAEDSLDDDDP